MTIKRVEVTFTDVVRTICLRPRMYLMHGSFGEALAFLDGYANGRMLGNSGRSGSIFNPFRQWLSGKLDLEDTEQFWPMFRDRYGDDQTALKQFAALWSEYEAANPNAARPMKLRSR